MHVVERAVLCFALALLMRDINIFLPSPKGTPFMGNTHRSNGPINYSSSPVEPSSRSYLFPLIEVKFY